MIFMDKNNYLRKDIEKNLAKFNDSYFLSSIFMRPACADAEHPAQQVDYTKVLYASNTIDCNRNIIGYTQDHIIPNDHPSAFIPLDQWGDWGEWEKWTAVITLPDPVEVVLGKRRELLTYVEELTFFDIYHKHWINRFSGNSVNRICSLSDFLEVFGFYEGEFGSGTLVFILRPVELYAVYEVANSLNKVIQEQGNRLTCPLSHYFASPSWNDVVESAKKAFAVLTASEHQ